MNIFIVPSRLKVTALLTNNTIFGSMFLVWGLLCVSGPALAYNDQDTVIFNITGTIDEPSCEIEVKPASAIDLGTIFSQRMVGKPGSSSADVPLSLSFSRCSLGMASATITFNGSPYDETFQRIYKNQQTGSDAAQGVGLQLVSAVDAQPLGPDDRYTLSINSDNAANDLNMIAKVYSPYGVIRGGTVVFTVTFDVSYK